MKKLKLSLLILTLTIISSLTINAQTLYITGAGDFVNGTWNPETPDEFKMVDGQYVYEVTNLTQFRISSSYGTWIAFNCEALWCQYGNTPGVEVPLELGIEANIVCPWKGDYKIVVSADLSTITLTTDTPKPSGTPPIYIRGDMNGWVANTAWEMTKVSDNVWRFICAEDQSITAEDTFKIADADWNEYNIGGIGYNVVSTHTVPFETLSEVYNGMNPCNLAVEADFNGVLWLVLDLDGEGVNYIELSNDKLYIPDWVELPMIIGLTHSFKDGLISFSCKTPNHSIYYRIGDEGEFTHYNTGEQIQLSDNRPVYYYATAPGYPDSDVKSYTPDYFAVENPTITFNEGEVHLDCSTPESTIFYQVGEDGNFTQWNPGQTLKVSDNRPIKFYASRPWFKDSPVQTFTPDYFSAEPATFSYDGRSITISATTPGATIKYTLNGANPTDGSPEISSGQKLDATGTGVLKAMVSAPYLNDAFSEFNIEYYFDGETATTTREGVLAKAFEWFGDQALTKLTVSGPANDADFTHIRSLSSIATLNLEKLKPANGNIPSDALKGLAGLVELTLPASAITSGLSPLAETPSLCILNWTAESVIPDGILEGISNPNRLLYVNSRSYAPASAKNVIVNGRAQEGLYLTPGHPFECRRAFTATKAEITREFAMTTGIGQSQGWETIALPFRADRFTHESAGECSPFAASSGNDIPFWLFSLSASCWEAATAVEAYTPYIISMPNNDEYADRYILGGKMTFSAENVEVPATRDGVSVSGVRRFISNMWPKEPDASVFNLNNAEHDGGYRPGSVFIPGLRKALPFEAYMTTSANERRISIFNDFTQVDELPAFGEEGLTVLTNDGAVIITSTRTRTVNLHDSTGRLIRTLRIVAGEEIRVDNLPHGLYFIDNIKVII